MAHTFITPTPSVGELLREEYLPEYELKAPTFAKKLGVGRQRVVRLLAGARCDSEMALRLARFFGTTPEYWMNLQAMHDLSKTQVEAGDRIMAEVEPLNAA